MIHAPKPVGRLPDHLSCGYKSETGHSTYNAGCPHCRAVIFAWNDAANQAQANIAYNLRERSRGSYAERSWNQAADAVEQMT